MDRTPLLRRAPLLLLLAVAVIVAAGVGVSCCSAASTPRPAAHAIRIGATEVGPAVPPGFVGISMEYKGLSKYVGRNPAAIDPAFVQLLRNLSPRGFVLRVGGDSTDWSWWPQPGLPAPGGVRYAVTPLWAALAKSLATEVGGRLMLGINFEADSRRVAAAEAAELVSHIGRSLIAGLELGNEPELYASFPWYKTSSGHHVYGRAAGYSPATLPGDFGSIAAALPPGVTVAGPSSGAPQWLGSIGRFAAAEPRVGLVTIHAYPLKHCNPHRFASPTDLFTGASLQGLADEIGGWVRAVGAHHRPLRVDEMNSVSCGGQKGLSQSFAPALWALDMLPRVLRTGAQGVNFHTVPNANNQLIGATLSHGSWQVSVEPEYYGLMTFSEAAPAGSRLLSVATPSSGGLDTWATRATNGQIHVVVINTTGRDQAASLSVAGASGSATVARLRAPGLNAQSGVTLGGEHLSATTGQLTGSPALTSVAPSNGVYPVDVPPWSAAILAVG